MYKLCLQIPKSNWIRFRNKSLKYLGPEVCNSLPYYIKLSENLKNFKTLIKSWSGTTCSVRYVKYEAM